MKSKFEVSEMKEDSLEGISDGIIRLWFSKVLDFDAWLKTFSVMSIYKLIYSCYTSHIYIKKL